MPPARRLLLHRVVDLVLDGNRLADLLRLVDDLWLLLRDLVVDHLAAWTSELLFGKPGAPQKGHRGLTANLQSFGSQSSVISFAFNKEDTHGWSSGKGREFAQ